MIDLGSATGLTCRECSATYDLGAAYACMECFGPLEVAYDFPALTRADIEAGPTSLWRYKDLLPVRPTAADEPNLAPGWTRLHKADNLAAELGMRTLWVKDDSGNPTHSFKDRVVAVAQSAAAAGEGHIIPVVGLFAGHGPGGAEVEEDGRFVVGIGQVQGGCARSLVAEIELQRFPLA